jgi:hypothetical protein
MARLVTLLQLRTRLEQRADIAGDQSLTTAEKTDLVNQSLTEVWDEITAETPPDYALTEAPAITTVAGTLAYSLPSDFYKMRAVQVDEGSGRRRSLDEMQPEQRMTLVAPAGGETVYLEYIPVCTTLVADGDTIDGVNGWDELAVCVAALQVYAKKRMDPPRALLMREQTTRARIQALGRRDAGTAPRLHRTRARLDGWPWATRSLTSYRIRGTATLELYRAGLP